MITQVDGEWVEHDSFATVSQYYIILYYIIY